MATPGWYPDGGGGQSCWDGTNWMGRPPISQQQNAKPEATPPGWYPDGGWDGKQWLGQPAPAASPRYVIRGKSRPNPISLLIGVGSAILVALIMWPDRALRPPWLGKIPAFAVWRSAGEVTPTGVPTSGLHKPIRLAVKGERGDERYR